MRAARQAEAVQGVGDGRGAGGEQFGDMPGQGLVFCRYLSPVSAAWNFASAITSTTDSPARMAAAIAS